MLHRRCCTSSLFAQYPYEVESRFAPGICPLLKELGIRLGKEKSIFSSTAEDG
jgi:hypothetical protein